MRGSLNMLDIRETSEVREAQSGSRAKALRTRAPRKMPEPDRGTRARGLKVGCVFSTPGVNPFDQIEWERRKASIADDKGNVIFVQEEVEVPKAWSMLATNVVASKYFFGPLGSDKRETSVRQLIHRVAPLPRVMLPRAAGRAARPARAP